MTDTDKTATTDISAPAAPVSLADAKPAERRRIVDEVVSKWVADQIANSPVSQTTEAWNHLQASLPTLKAAILKEL